jgi:hypothetical protein
MLVQSIAKELGVSLSIVLETDSMIAFSGCQRRGVLHVKHMALRLLFLKELVERGLVQIARVASEDNTADWLTKPVGPAVHARCLHSLVGLRHGRAEEHTE